MVATGGEAAASDFLFDTSVVIAAFKDDAPLTRRLRQFPADRHFVPAIVLGTV